MGAPTVCSNRAKPCFNLTDVGLCDDCRRERARESNSRRPNSRRRGYDAKWERTRAAYLREHPYCEDGCDQLATDVDHIDGQGPLGPRGHDHSNLRALCHSHHSKRTARDQPGGWNR